MRLGSDADVLHIGITALYPSAKNVEGAVFTVFGKGLHTNGRRSAFYDKAYFNARRRDVHILCHRDLKFIR